MDWAVKLAKEEAWVIHVPTGTIGQVGWFFGGGEHDQYVSPAGMKACGPVLKFQDGNALFANQEEKFARLTEDEVRLYQVILHAVSGTVGELAVFAAALKVDRKLFETMATSVLARQMRELAAFSQA